MGYQRTVIYSGGSEGTGHIFLSFNNFFLLGLCFSIFLINHLNDLRLITVGQQIMRGIDVLQALLIVFSSLIINEFIFVLDLDRENLHSIDKLLGVCSIVLREIHIYKARQCVAISSHSHYSIFISMTIDYLFMKSSFFIPRANILTILRINGIPTQNSISFISIELSNCILLLLFNSLLVFCLQFSNLSVMLLFECKILLHYTIHVSIIYINYNNLFSFFESLIFILQSKLFCELFFKSTPFVLFI